MSKILLVLALPAGIVLILGMGTALASRSPRPRPPSEESFAQRLHGALWRRLRLAAARERRSTRFDELKPFLLVLVVAVPLLYGAMVLLGLLAEHAGPSIDKPILHWVVRHRIHVWHSAMLRGTEVGDKYPIWAAATTAAVCLAVTWRSHRWLPPLALGALVLTEHFLTLAINHTVARVPPPGSGGTFPSGGTDRAVAFYGLIAYLLWREFSGRRRTAIIAGSVVAALGFEEGYSRVYLAVHWFTDVVGGFVYGCLLATVFIIAVAAVAGPARGPSATSAPERMGRGEEQLAQEVPS